MPESIQLFYTIAEAAPLLRRTRESIRASCQRGTIPARKVLHGDVEMWEIPATYVDPCAGRRSPLASLMAAKLLPAIQHPQLRGILERTAADRASTADVIKALIMEAQPRNAAELLVASTVLDARDPDRDEPSLVAIMRLIEEDTDVSSMQ